MTDDELIAFLGLQGVNKALAQRLVASMTPEKRATYDKMRDVEKWAQGEGPRPEGVIVDFGRKRKWRGRTNGREAGPMGRSGAARPGFI